MLKKFLYFVLASFFLFVVSLAVLSRVYGSGIRISDGRYLGYSPTGQEWLFLQYQNTPVVHDGPYVLTNNNQRVAHYVSGDGKNASTHSKVLVSDNVQVTVDNLTKTSFVVNIRDNYPRSRLNIEQPDKLFVLSDMEGNFDAMVLLLSANSVINDSLEWSYGIGHVVLVGDMVDRGENVVPLLWLIYKLEAEAKAAGGEVHYVLGNHERYLLDGRVKSAARKYYGTFRNTGMSPRELWSVSSELGRWLRSKPVVLKIGDTLFVHGGVSPRVLNHNPTLQSIDAESEAHFVIGDSVRRNVGESIIHGSDGLLFYRNLAKDLSQHGLGEKANLEHVDQVLAAFNVNRIVIGHTLAEQIGYDYSGKVIRVDVPHFVGISEALLIEENNLWRSDHKGNKYSLEEAVNFTGL